MLCDAFTQVLKSGRADFNQQVAQARRENPNFEDAAFSAFVQTCMDPLVAAVHAAAPEAVADLVQAMWETGLQLVAQRLAGPQAREPWINHTWQHVLPMAAAHVARAPGTMLGSFSNAAHHLSTTPGARPGEWIEVMTAAAGMTTDVNTLLKAGQVAAWRCGLAHYRESALRQAQELPPDLALVVLQVYDAEWPALHAALSADPWHVPGEDFHAGHEVLRAGAFCGFGGLFPSPPHVIAANDQLFVRSGDEVWLLTADAFGATFHRATQEEFSQGVNEEFPGITPPSGIGMVTSIARTRSTVAITGTLTHAVILFTPP
ncbi:MAG TPA: hypothetical protein VGE39_08805 [Prosthecobacter sp.]